MLRTIIIGAERGLSEKLEALFNDVERFDLLRTIETYPEGTDLERILRAHAPHVVFLCAETLAEALKARVAIDQTVSGVSIVGFGRNCNEQVLLELMKVGVREFLPLPFTPQAARELADRIDKQLAEDPVSFGTTDLLFSFLPAKPGVGTSTLALNLSVAMSKQLDTKALLADFDLNSGLIAFMLKINSPYSLVEAVEKSMELDENLWPQLVTEMGKLDVLPSGRSTPGTRIQPVQIRRLLSFARRQYGVICVDLSGNMEKYSIELMQESKRIFLVTTAEIPPLHLARERYSFLTSLDLGDRICVLLNRWEKRSSVSKAQVEDLLGVPVFETFPNRYAEVHQALMAGQPLAANTDLGKRFTAVAKRILGLGAGTDRQPRKKFLQHFSVLPSKSSVEA